MKTCRINLEVELEIDAFNFEDAADVAREAILDMEGLGIKILDVAVTGECET